MTSSLSPLKWFLVHCKPRQDARALENLERQGYHCFAPMRSVERLLRGGRKVLAEPLFPGYFFIRLDAVNDNWSPLRSTRGVHEIVRFNEYPLPVPDAIIDSIQARLETEVGYEPCLKEGERVRITEGAFSGLEAVFVSGDGNERVVLLMNILQRYQHIVFPLKSVRRIA